MRKKTKPLFAIFVLLSLTAAVSLSFALIDRAVFSLERHQQDRELIKLRDSRIQIYYNIYHNK